MPKLTQPIGFHEIDREGNHVIRLIGGTEESQEIIMNKMFAAGDMYEALKQLLESYSVQLDDETEPKYWRDAAKALIKATGR